jgi:endonuclease YncB( thermonuclease family)
MPSRRRASIRWTRKKLLAIGIPAVLIPGILTAVVLGWNPKVLEKAKNYYEITSLFPKTGVVREVYDGDTFRLQSRVEVRMIGIDAPNRGEQNYDAARTRLTGFIDGERVYLEYDRYQDDKYGRVLAWVWTGCEREPEFLPADYMHQTGNASRKGLTENPQGCKSGKLVNEEMVREGLAVTEQYEDRGELKYEQRLKAE